MGIDSPLIMAQNGKSEKFTVESQAIFFMYSKRSSFHRNRSADICLLMHGLGGWAILSLGYLYEIFIEIVSMNVESCFLGTVSLIIYL